jgi:hypothetical protein
VIAAMAPILCALFGSILALADLWSLHWGVSRFARLRYIALFGVIRWLLQAIGLSALIKPFGPIGLIAAIAAWSLTRVIYLHRTSGGTVP